MSASDEPLAPDEVDALFEPLFPGARPPKAALAVSGGGDSTALMVLFAEWLRRGGHDVSRHTVLTVDHGLRAQSRAEAELVAREARAFGFRHATLAWSEDKPQTGIQQAARRARYRLLGAFARSEGIAWLLTAHTRDDQAETLLMRLGRGSGLDGLSAIAPVVDLADLDRDAVSQAGTISVVRPLLEVPKARLTATLSARGLAWIEDPSNQSPAYERARLRAARAGLDALGLTPAVLALSARRLLRARRALEAEADRFCDPAAAAVVTDPCGFFAVDLARLCAGEAEIALRVLARLVAVAGGSVDPVPYARLEAIAEALCPSGALCPCGVASSAGLPAAARWTLARALITARDGTVIVEREPPREPLPHIALSPGGGALSPGGRIVWDGRFRVWVDAEPLGGSGVEVRPLGEQALADLRRRGCLAAQVRASAAALTPSFWAGQELLAAPPLGYFATAEARRSLHAEFIGLPAPKRK